MGLKWMRVHRGLDGKFNEVEAGTESRKAVARGSSIFQPRAFPGFADNQTVLSEPVSGFLFGMIL